MKSNMEKKIKVCIHDYFTVLNSYNEDTKSEIEQCKKCGICRITKETQFTRTQYFNFKPELNE